MNNTTVWLSSLTAFLAFLGVALGVLLKWVNDNKGTIVQLIQAIREIKGRVDQHDKMAGVVTSETVAWSSSTGKPIVSSTTPSEPVSLSSDTLRTAFPPPSSDALHETPDRLRVGVNDPHDVRDVAAAIIQAKP
jgi:hypothetical protein